MSFWETFRAAMWSLQSNRLRSFLSMLGIIIGVAAVVAVVAIGTGARQQVLQRVSALGSNMIMINPAAVAGRGGRVSVDATQLFTPAVARQIAQVVPAVRLVAPQVQGSGLLIHEGSNLRARIVGVTPDYQTVANYGVERGRFIHALDDEYRSNVIALGSRVASDLFGHQNPLGFELVMVMGERRYTFTVVGVMETKGSVMMAAYDSQVYIPLATAMERVLRQTTVSSLLAQAVSSEKATEAVAQIEFFLASRLGTTEGFRITSQDEMLDTMGQVAQTLQLMLGAIGSISLLVGGIGVMNIMLVSVTERTQEIGTRKALGAKRRDLLAQFIVESLVLSITGGAIGLVAGSGLARLASQVGGWDVEVTIASLVLAFGFSALVGLMAGVYPAMKAARLDPVMALSYE